VPGREAPRSSLEVFPRWTPSKRGHEMKAFARMTPHGPELAITVDGQPLESQVLGGVDVITFAGIVDATRRLNEAEGWE
jgi:hypothetical protein